eukprot:g10635.t1
MDEKIQNALLTSDEKSYVKRIKELEQIVDAQKVTEQILVAELEKLKTQINAVGGATNKELEKEIRRLNEELMVVGNGAVNIPKSTNDVQFNEEGLIIMGLKDDIAELQRKLNKSELLVSKLVKDKNSKIELEVFMNEKNKFDEEKRRLRRDASLMQSSLIESRRSKNELQIEINRQRDFFKAREDAIINGTKSLNKKVSGQEKQIEQLHKALKSRKKKFIVRKSDDTGTIFVDEVDKVMTNTTTANPSSVHSIHSSRKAALSDIELVLTKSKLEEAQKKLKVLEDMQGPMQQEVLKLRGHNQSLLEKLNKIRSSFEVKLALQKSQMLKQTLSTNLYNASHRKRNTLTPESIMTVSVYEKKALISRKNKLRAHAVNNQYNHNHSLNMEEKQQQGKDLEENERIKTTLNVVPPRVSYHGVNRMKIDKNSKSLPFLNVSGYD